MADIYAHPTIRTLAPTLPGRTARAPRLPAPRADRRTTTPRLLGCGAAQIGALGALLLLLGAPVAVVLGSAAGVLSLGTIWTTIAAAASTYVVGRFGLPEAGVRLLARRVRPGDYPLWSAAYLRVWLIQTLLALARSPR